MVELTEEERRQIYEEEKAKLESVSSHTSKSSKKTLMVGFGILIFFCILIMASNSNPSSQETADLPLAQETTTSDSPQPIPAAPVETASQYVVQTGVKLQHLHKDYDASRYHSSIAFTPQFKNISGKTIVGIKFDVDFVNGFHESLLSGGGYTLDQRIAPGGTSSMGNWWQFEDNPFIPDEPYDKLFSAIDGNTAKPEIKVTNIAFADGTSKSF